MHAAFVHSTRDCQPKSNVIQKAETPHESDSPGLA